MIQHQQQRINAARHTARSLQSAGHFGNAAYSILCRHRFHNRANHGVCNAEEGPPQFRTAQGDAEPIPRRTTDRPWRRILFPLKQAHQQENDDIIRYGKMIVCTYGRRPAVPRSFAHARPPSLLPEVCALEKRSRVPGSLGPVPRLRNYSVVAVREVVQAFECESGFHLLP
jgi:hypothetical protein